MRLTQVRLISLGIKAVQLEPNDTSVVSFGAQSRISVLDRKDGIVRVRLKESFRFKPAGPFEAEMEIGARCKVDDAVSDEELSKAVEDVSYPLYSMRSLLLAILSDQILGTPLMMPPTKPENVDEV